MQFVAKGVPENKVSIMSLDLLKSSDFRQWNYVFDVLSVSF